MSNKVKTVLIVIAILVGGVAVACGLSACGSGGGGGGSTNQGDNTGGTNNPPSGGGSTSGNTVLGSADTNSNEVPDEIDAWISSAAPNSAKTRAALTQTAVGFTHALLDADDPNLSRDNAREISRAQACLRYSVGLRPAIDLSDELKAQFLNTSERSKAYVEYDGHLGGTSVLPPSDGSTCNFDLTTLPN